LRLFFHFLWLFFNLQAQFCWFYPLILKFKLKSWTWEDTPPLDLILTNGILRPTLPRKVLFFGRTWDTASIQVFGSSPFSTGWAMIDSISTL
jgi:hypothetical protein